MRCAVQLRANRKTLLAESIARLDAFLARVEREAPGEDGGRTLNLLDDCFLDYMPSVRLT